MCSTSMLEHFAVCVVVGVRGRGTRLKMDRNSVFLGISILMVKHDKVSKGYEKCSNRDKNRIAK